MFKRLMHRLAQLFAVGVILGFLALGAVGLLLWHVSQDLPDYADLAKYEPPVTTRVHAGDGRLMAEYAHERRLFVPIAAMPPRVIEAFLSAEDKNFYHHPGVDFMGVARAMLTNVTQLGQGRRPVGPGSPERAHATAERSGWPARARRPCRTAWPPIAVDDVATTRSRARRPG